MHNLFQGNDLILRKIADVWGYDLPDEQLRGSMTRDIFYQSFFYLTQRFGAHQKWDEYNDAGLWIFEVDEYHIHILLNTSWVIVTMFGDEKHKGLSMSSPYNVARNRAINKRRDEYVSLFSDEKTEKEKKILETQWKVFCNRHGIDETWDNERFKKEKADDWLHHMQDYNERLIGIDYVEFREKHGTVYQNKQTRKALRVLEKFLKNMLTPVSVRDCNYNIKGECGSEFDRYINNIEIKFINDRQP